MKKKSVIIVGAVLVILCVVGIILFFNNRKEEKETGSFFKTNFQVNGYDVYINSKESGHAMEGSHFNTSFYIKDSKKYIHSYEVDIIDLKEIDKKDINDDRTFVKINGKKFYYYINNDNNTATLEYYAKVSGKRLVLEVKVTGMSVFDYMGNLTREMSKIDEAVLSSDELSSILNISINKVKEKKKK